MTLVNSVAIDGPGGRTGAELLPGVQPKVAFAYLTLHCATPVPMVRLASALWGEEPPTTWQPALRALVSTVRSFIAVAAPAASLTREAGGYVLNLPPPVEVDIEVAKLQARLMDQALDGDQPDEALDHAVRVLSVAAGSFLPRSRSPWVAHVAEDLTDLHLRALHVLGTVHIQRGEPDRARRTAREAIALDPFHEASHRLAMRAAAAAGETGEASKVFHRYRQRLRDELGVDPSEQTTALLTEILRS